MKEAFNKYKAAREEKKECKDPCIKNGRSDQFCLKCGEEIIKPLIDKKS